MGFLNSIGTTQTQKLVLKHTRNVLDQEIDDLAITFFTQEQGFDHPNYYGFNQSLAKAYQKSIT